MAKKFYRELKTHSASFQPRLNLCLDINGNTLTEEKKILERWKEHFQSTLNIYTASEEEDNGILLPEDEMEVPAPSRKEIVDIIREMKNGKAGGEDNITAELVKFGGVELHSRIHQLISLVWSSECMPEDWQTCVLFSIHKKGDKKIAKTIAEFHS
ncbi:uncharacterized protein LOC143903519 [Temnothorax americanus]|uniref:uncharacterized protein LOC143903519 n=1 Tax=Temnothorax americanus TaxID=1964332 RepID=UPI004068E488